MPMNDKLRGLLLLLAAHGMVAPAVACTPGEKPEAGDDDDGDSGDDDDGNGDSTGDDDDSTGDDSPDDDDDSPNDDDDSPGDDDDTSESFPQVCQDLADWYVGCYEDVSEEYADYIAMYCEYALEVYGQYYGSACAAAYEDYFACIARLDCDVFEDGDSYCVTELVFLELACDTDGVDPDGVDPDDGDGRHSVLRQR